MYKVIFPHQFEDGPIHIVNRDFTKTAKRITPEIAEALASLQKQAGITYLHINALGEDEIWGSNVNGDGFPRAGLTNKTASYGYKTFEKFAHAYRHHVNKDPLKAMGRIVTAAYNPVMHRVELIVGVENEKNPSLIEKVADGEYPEWSMGCKVPWDQCSLCMHKAATVKDYCECLRTRMNKIAESGVRIRALNHFPKFFDISEVIVGADKTARTLQKVATAGPIVISSAELGLEVYGEDQEEKRAEPKTAEIEKEIPVDVDPHLQASMVAVQGYEPAFPKSIIKKLASFPLGEALSTLSYSGILLKPGEFQGLVLRNQGQDKLAEDLEGRGIEILELCERDVNGVWERDDSLTNPDLVKKAAFDTIAAFIPHRSIFEPYIHDRLAHMNVLPPSRLKTAQAKTYGWVKTASPGLIELLGSLGLSYFLYRKGFPTEVKEFEAVMRTHPWMVPIVMGGSAGAINLVDAIAGPSGVARSNQLLRDAQVKTGGRAGSFAKAIGSVVGPVGLAYLGAASAKRKEMEGYELNPVESVIRDYPAVIGPAGALALMAGRKHFSHLGEAAGKILKPK